MPFTSIRPTYIYGPLNYNPLEEWFFERLDQVHTAIYTHYVVLAVSSAMLVIQSAVLLSLVKHGFRTSK
jgi:hypothetical protein